MLSKFGICDNKGFHLTLPNGVTVSTQFGPGNYCDNYNDDIVGRDRQKPCESYTVECAAWYSILGYESVWITPDEQGNESGDVRGYLTMQQWLEFVDWCRAYVPDHEKLLESAKVKTAERNKWREEAKAKYGAN